MATFQKADSSVFELASEILTKHESHQPILDRRVKIDFVFAYGERDETTGELISFAIKKGGVRCGGQCRAISLKDRAKGMGDAEVLLDHDHWEDINEKEKMALLDHELHHIVVTAKNDDLGRPKLKMRKHDFEVGWFKIIADRNGVHSVEQQQAKRVFDEMGQSFWPALAAARIDAGEQAAQAMRKVR